MARSGCLTTKPSTQCSCPACIHCPKMKAHTPAPHGYLAWHEWAATMARTHRQKKCDGCGRMAIWVPKPVRAPTSITPGRSDGNG